MKFSEFCDRNKEAYEKFVDPSVIIYGEDYDLPSELYEASKAKSEEEGYDEASFVEGFVKNIQDKIDALEALKEKVEEKADEPVEEKVEEESPSEEQLSKEFEVYAR